jgi:hypothetical protein
MLEMFSKRHIAQGLKPLGFLVADESSTDILLIRPDMDTGLFEAVRCNAGKRRGGRWGNYSSASVNLQLTPGYFTSCTVGEHELISDFADTRKASQAKSWATMVVQSVPEKLRKARQKIGQETLACAAAVRVACDEYLRFIDLSMPREQLIEELSHRMSDEEKREAKRIASLEGIICLDERKSYDLLSMLMTHFAGQVEGDSRVFWGKDPYQVRKFLWRIQMLASRIHPEPGWEIDTKVTGGEPPTDD